MNKLFDRSLLIITGLIASALAAVYFRSTGQYGLDILALVFVALMIIDNRQMRKRIRELERELAERK